MATTNFLQFNPGAINQETDPEYAGDSQRAGGYGTDSIVPSPLLNKFSYQASTFIAAFGQMMANKGFSTSDADAGVLAAVLANLLTTADQIQKYQTLAYSPTPAFNLRSATAYQMTLSGNVNSSTYAGSPVPGQIYVFVWIQDGVGGRTVSLPPSTYGVIQPDPAPGSVSLQAFITDGGGGMRAIGPLVSNNGIFTGAVTSTSINAGSVNAGGLNAGPTTTGATQTGALTAGSFTLLGLGAPRGKILIGDGSIYVPRSFTLTDVSGARGFNTQFQNTSGAEMEVYVIANQGSSGGSMTASAGPASASMNITAASRVPAASSNPVEPCGLGFRVPVDWFYQVSAFNLNFQSWVEGTYV